ncbi:Bromodomain-containing protein [Microdochium trichocladiopsis]|uniref:Bromodomain-containing protein n=1 Tax=Microdochium trichocladiopsis TaxID=1682393 RepID=A0A9P8Y0A3_9PEZI|nr:Bromodomain-containing protein [Microdochium trichocladiopsis]KAH7027433.1 Bromodomain-containing protein [Microdochium trichocladiopsis]
MDNKRKASGVNGHEPAADTPDRASKRRRLQEEFGDLSQGETPESTTAYGLNILETIRATTDKNGRAVAPFFEVLPPPETNPDYYRKIRLPLSLDIIEQKLLNHQYSKLSALEGDFKRLVSNAKETNARQSEIFGDAERVRKAVSNLMVKYNPAYKLGNYQATATPLPSEGGRDAHGDINEMAATPVPNRVRIKSRTQPQPRQVEPEADDEDAEGEDDDDEEEDAGGRSARRKSSSRTLKITTSSAQKQITRNPAAVKHDTLYENVDYKGLSFQQAQEKVVEEMIRKKDEGGDYQLFEVFMFLPARSLKDYYEVIAEPMSVKKFQKQVRGLHGRGDPTWVSDFKTWTAFEDQASLIWKNAYHYNEDGSDIFTLAQEFEEFFYDQLKQAKLHAPEPPAQPKIKLKVSQNVETPTHPKKITIHVGGKSSAGASPAPGATLSSEAGLVRSGTPLGQTPYVPSGPGSFNGGPLERTRSAANITGSPSPSLRTALKAETHGHQSPGVAQNTTLHTFAPHPSVLRHDSNGNLPMGSASAQAAPPRRTATDILESQKYRLRPISDSAALMSKLVINSHPGLPVDNNLHVSFPASATEFQQDITVNAPPTHFRLQLRPHIASFLEAEQREWKLHVMHDQQRLYPSAPYEKRNEPVFDATMRYGANRIEVSLVAALPQGETGPNGLNMELEKFTINYNLQRAVL